MLSTPLTGRNRILINPHASYHPIRLRHLLRVLSHILLTRRRSSRARTAFPDASGPLATERRVENEVVVLEVIVDVALPRKLRRRLPPRTWVRRLGVNVRRDLRAGEEPDLDRAARPLRRVHAAAIGVEAGAERGAVRGRDTAARVLGLGGVFDVAVRCRCGA